MIPQFWHLIQRRIHNRVPINYPCRRDNDSFACHTSILETDGYLHAEQ